MATSLTESAIQALIKENYANYDYNALLFRKYPLFDTLTKNTKGGGRGRVSVAVQYQLPTNRSRTRSSAATNSAPRRQVEFLVPYANDFGYGFIDDDVIMDLMNKNFMREAGDIVKQEIDNALEALMTSIEKSLFGNQGGSMGVIKSFTNNQFTLTNPEDSINFDKGQVLNFASTDGTTGAVRSGNVTVDTTDKVNGIVYTTAYVTGGISQVAVNDNVFIEGDFGAAFPGLHGQLPTTRPSSSESFCSVDRSVSPDMLAGVVLTSNGGPLYTEIQAAIALGLRINPSARYNCIFLHPTQFATLVNSLGLQREGGVGSGDGKLASGGNSVIIYAPVPGSGAITVKSSPWCGVLDCWILDTKLLEIESVGPVVDVNRKGGYTLQRTAAATGDSWIFEVKSRLCLKNKLPGGHVRLRLPSAS